MGPVDARMAPGVAQLSFVRRLPATTAAGPVRDAPTPRGVLPTAV
jgi:hypothetical protein